MAARQWAAIVAPAVVLLLLQRASTCRWSKCRFT